LKQFICDGRFIRSVQAVYESVAAESGYCLQCLSLPDQRATILTCSRHHARSTRDNESAGKRKSGKTTKGSQYLRTVLVQAAWAASRKKGTYLSAQYQRLVKRMGKNKALVAVGHSILVMAYFVLLRKQSYQELGGDYFDRPLG
jgi:Transposase IS116/IS110/IS902 family